MAGSLPSATPLEPRGSGGPAADPHLVAPGITLPKGGGAIRGMGEKFLHNPVTGTATAVVPIALSPGRAGFTPALSLSYDSGNGNSAFGFGWALDLPSITRSTERALPTYDDEVDVFRLTGHDDLVAAERGTAGRRDIAPGYLVYRYRPRVESEYLRIERWVRERDGDTHWRTYTPDNVLSVFGRDGESRIAHPTDLGLPRVFTWLLSHTQDSSGSVIAYTYKAEDGIGADPRAVHQRNRGPVGDRARSANRYLKSVRYGNARPLLDPATGTRAVHLDRAALASVGWFFQLVVDYGEHDQQSPSPAEVAPWDHREDAFSTYRAGFEVRTARLARRLLMFHDIPDVPAGAPGYRGLVRSTDLEHTESPQGYSYLHRATGRGYQRDGAGYLVASLPSVEFAYTAAVLRDELRPVGADRMGSPVAVPADASLLDLRGDGAPGLVVAAAPAWYYAANRTPAGPEPEGRGQLDFGPLSVLSSAPNVAAVQFADLAGDGALDVVDLQGSAPGFTQYQHPLAWQHWRAFTAVPRADLGAGQVRFADLTGDGLPDILGTDAQGRVVWQPCLGADGYGPARRTEAPADEELGLQLDFSDTAAGLRLADMSGDGLADLVRVTDAGVCYWPNLGYGRFGAKVTLDSPDVAAGSPAVFDNPDRFDPARLLLVDVDGSGTADVIYLHDRGARVYLNRSGNALSEPVVLASMAGVADPAEVTVADLFGNGTVGLVWRRGTPAQNQVRHLDLVGTKPHLLARVSNNLGATTRISYSTSTRAALADELAGHPWAHRLPFPVHVVARVDTHDGVSGNALTELFAYHDGCFDGRLREFRGFAMVERWDSEYPAEAGAIPEADEVLLAAATPPVHTLTWYHTGMPEDLGRALPRAWRGQRTQVSLIAAPGQALDLVQAARALKGAMVRQEVWGDREAPYTVLEQSYTVEQLTAPAPGSPGTYRRWQHDTVTYHHEQLRSDPRVEQVLTLAVNAYGTALDTVHIGYGRTAGDRSAVELRDLGPGDAARQAETLVTHVQWDMTNPVDISPPGPGPVRHPLDFRHPVPAQERTYQITGLARPVGRLFAVADFPDGPAGWAGLREVPFEQPPPPGQTCRRLTGARRTRYRADSLAEVLPLGTLQSRGLIHEQSRAALTPGLLSGVFGGEVTPATLVEGGYRSDPDGTWWAPSGQPGYSPLASDTPAQELAHARAHFFQPVRYTDPFGNQTTVRFDDHDLLLVAAQDAVGNQLSAGTRRPDGNLEPGPGNDYRVLAPQVVTDATGNRTMVRFDPLGMVSASAVMGSAPPAPQQGDKLDQVPDIDADALASFLVDPVGRAAGILGSATSRQVSDLGAFSRDGSPAAVFTLTRSRHGADPGRIEVAVSYSDGFGRVAQAKRLVAPGQVPRRDQAGRIVVDGDGVPVLAEGVTQRRWAVTGWTVHNNKGSPVRQYEPFITDTHRYEAAVAVGVSSVLCRDPAQRVVAVVHPDHTWEKTVINPWFRQSWDCSDTLLIANPAADPDVGRYIGRLPAAAYLPGWHPRRAGGALGPAEQRNAEAAAVHANTPTTEHLDALGRTILTVGENRHARPGEPETVAGLSRTSYRLDIGGNVVALGTGTDRLLPERLRRTSGHDLAGTPVAVATAEEGPSWVLPDVVGRPIRERRGSWLRRTLYDALRRPTQAWIDSGAGTRLAERTTYGESLGGNHRGRVHRTEDGAGRLTVDTYDFKGNPTARTRELLADYRGEVDWSAPPVLEPAWSARLSYDAANRPITSQTPDGTVQSRAFDVSGQLAAVTTAGPGGAAGFAVISAIEYDAHGRRTAVGYGNGVAATYRYDPRTFRLLQARTTRPPAAAPHPMLVSPTVVSDLRYLYDPSGNVVEVADLAQATVIHDQQVVEPIQRYTYDAAHRLIAARGREHIGQNAPAQPGNGRRDWPFAGPGVGVEDLAALRNYTQDYFFDDADNLARVRHVAAGGNWTREYEYTADSLLQPGTPSDRLTRTTVGGGPGEAYRYDQDGTDAAGAMTAINSTTLTWGFPDRLRSADLGGGGRAHYSYDATGNRVRKVVESTNGVRRHEQLYLDGFEVHREYSAAGQVVRTRSSVHVHDGATRVALIETTSTDPDRPQLRLQVSDHVGTAALELAADAALISYEQCHPLGTTALQVVSGEVSARRYRYTGKERDNETGLYCFGARYYLPWVGRWLSCDPAEGPGGRYEFCRSNPIVLVDPDGRQEIPAVVGKAPDCATAKVHPKSHPQPPGPGLLQAMRDTKKAVVDGVLWITSAGGVSSLEESKKKYDQTRSDPSLPPQGPATPLTNEIVAQTPSASGELWLAWAGAAGRTAKPTPAGTGVRAVGGASRKTVREILKDMASQSLRAGAKWSVETVKDMLRATGRLVAETPKDRALQLLESEVEFVLEDPGAGKWASYGGTKAEVVTWDSFKSPATGKVRVKVDPRLFSAENPGAAMQKMAHELYELQGLKEKLGSTPGGMAQAEVQKLIDSLHSNAITEEARVLADWKKLRAEAQGQ